MLFTSGQFLSSKSVDEYGAQGDGVTDGQNLSGDSIDKVILRDNAFYDWGLAGLEWAGDVDEPQGVGYNRTNGLQILVDAEHIGNRYIVSGKESAASTDAGHNQSGALDGTYLLEGANFTLGTTSGGNWGVGDATEYTIANFA